MSNYQKQGQILVQALVLSALAVVFITVLVNLAIFNINTASRSFHSEQAFQIARKNNYILRAGSLAMMPGPQYETPLEIQLLYDLHIIDIVGMSTVPEVIALRAMDKKILGLACVTNMAAGLSEQKLSHKEVMETAAKAEKDFSFLLTEFIKGIPE